MRRRPFVLFAPLAAVFLFGLLPAACGGSGGSGSSAHTGGNGGAGSGGSSPHDGGVTASSASVSVSSSGSSGGGAGGGISFADHADCVSGQACGDGGVCTGSVCCSASQACGSACCAAGDVCSFQVCVTPGATCQDSSDCSGSEYCEYSLGNNATDAGVSAADASCMGGFVPLNGKCLPTPPTCAADAGADGGGALTCLEQCAVHPTMSTFNPSVTYAWGGTTSAPFATDVMMTPIVVQLDDDDCDGKVTARDIPEIVFSTFSNGAYHGDATSTLHAISIIGGQVVEKWSVAGVVNPTAQIAGGNIDGLPGNEVVACGQDGAVHAFKGDGTPYWTSAAMTCFMPSIGDLDGDGFPEVVVEGGILDGATGALKAAFASTLDSPLVLSDIDGDGKLDVVTANRGYHGDGTVFVDTMLVTPGQFPGTTDWKGAWSAVADFDHDGKPEVVIVDNTNHAVSMWRYDATQPNKFSVVRAPVDINTVFTTNACTGWGQTHGGGPPTIADFDGDGVPDVGTAGGIGYVVFSGAKLIDATVTGSSTILWGQPTHDCSSASTGSSVFDFDGDGKAEVVYSDEYYLRIYDGTNGDVLFQACNTTATLVEYPVIADVDNDGHADIVVVSNAYADTCPEDGSKQSGVRIFGGASGSWVRTRAVWNEHAYHVTNVNDDGTIPASEPPNWTQPGLNDFRQNKQPGSEFAAPDAVVSIAPSCGSPYGLVATVRNIGQAALPAGVVVGFYEGVPGSGTKLGQATTTTVLYPAESQALLLTLSSPDVGLMNGTTPAYAIVDDTTTPHPAWTECRTDNDTGGPSNVGCAMAQ